MWVYVAGQKFKSIGEMKCLIGKKHKMQIFKLHLLQDYKIIKYRVKITHKCRRWINFILVHIIVQNIIIQNFFNR